MRLEQIRCADIVPPDRAAAPLPDVDPLADSVRRHGVLRPVLLRETPEGYVIVHGERRWQAARLAGLEAIPACLVQDILHEDRLEAECR